MVVIDSDIFVRDLRYTRDSRHTLNRQFLTAVAAQSEHSATTIFNVLEVCGKLSFNLNRRQLLSLHAGFAGHHAVEILAPAVPMRAGQRVMDMLVGRTFGVMLRKIAFTDALIIHTAESNPRVATFVTWNAKHFKDKTRLQVLTPEEWLIAYASSAGP